MKKTAFFVAAALLFSFFTATAQRDTTKVIGNTVITSKTFLPMPEALTNEKIFPVLGTYQSTQSNMELAGNISITLDPENKGTVWVEGLSFGKIKATLRKSPSTYKVPAQKTEAGKDVPEGALVYNKETNVLDICIGCKYNDVDPAQSFVTTATTETEVAIVETGKKTNKKAKVKEVKPETKIWTYTGAKIDASTASGNK